MVEKNGKSYTVKGDVGLSGLSPECRLYMELSEEVLRQCSMFSAKAQLDMFKNNTDVLHFDRCTFNACMFILGLSKVRWYCLLHCSSCYYNANQDSSLCFWCFSQGHRMCLSLEAAITAEEQRSAKNTPFFPITIGR